MSFPRKIAANAPRITLIGLILAVAPAGPARGQGFGPDPFRPLNSQFDPYVYPMGPAGPGGGQAAAMMPNRQANQFQDYLNEVQGVGRQRTEKYGIGVPYYRSAIDPLYSRAADRDYQPNRASQRSFEETQQFIADKYLAFMAEKDPKKRAELFRTYDQARRRSAKAMSTRRASPSRIMSQARRDGEATAPESATGSRAGARSRARAETGRGSESPGGREPSIPAPPPISRPRGSRSAARSPSETLERARALNPETVPGVDPIQRPARSGSRPRPPSND